MEIACVLQLVLMGHRKELPLEGALALRFTCTEALDTAANIYQGVRALAGDRVHAVG